MLRVSNLNLKSVFLVGFDLIMLFNSHKKQKGSLVTRAVLPIFLLKLQISGVAIQEIHQNSKNDCFE